LALATLLAAALARPMEITMNQQNQSDQQGGQQGNPKPDQQWYGTKKPVKCALD
jgi:hypothetical protein